MAGIDTSELLVLFVVALIVLGPERLPRFASRVARWVGRARREAYRLHRQIERQVANPPPSGRRSRSMETRVDSRDRVGAGDE